MTRLDPQTGTSSSVHQKFVEAFRDSEKVREVAQLLGAEARPDRSYHFMEFCGGHTHVIFRYGLHDLLPKNVIMVHGPGCPVCVLPRGRIDSVLQLLSQHPDVTVCTYADLMRVPGADGINFFKAKAGGADIRMVYSPDDALKIAKENPKRRVVFLGIGFETTAPATAVTVLQAEREQVANFFVYGLHLLTPAAIQSILTLDEKERAHLDGFVGPGHVSAVIGTQAYVPFAEKYQKPVVISGFAPLDMMQSILYLVRMCNQKQAGVMNQYTRVVGEQGNLKAQQVLDEVFMERETFAWRGLGEVKNSALKLRPRFRAWDAEAEFDLKDVPAKDHPACQCAAIIRGVKTPRDCKLFRKACTPENPIGPCMVSSEGTCSAYYTYRDSDPLRGQT